MDAVNDCAVCPFQESRGPCGPDCAPSTPGVRVSIIDDLPQLAAVGVSNRLQRLAATAGITPRVVGAGLSHILKAAAQHQLDALRAKADLDAYLNLADCLGVSRDTAQQILGNVRAYLRPWTANAPPTTEEIEYATGLLHAVAPLTWKPEAAREGERRDREQRTRLSTRLTAALAGRTSRRRYWPCGCDRPDTDTPGTEEKDRV